MKGSSFVSLTDSPLPQIFPLAQLLSPKCSHRQRRATSSCESINSWNDTHCVKNILWKKTKTNMDSYTTELKGVLAYWDSPRQYGCAALCLVTQLCPILCDPMDCKACQAPLSMVVLQTRILEWVAMPSSRASSQHRDWTQVSLIAGRFFTIWATREAQYHCS